MKFSRSAQCHFGKWLTEQKLAYKPLNKIDKVISDLMLPENQTKEKAHERLLRAGIIDENGNLNEPYK